jgi:antitoxin (DNA-binding transcriptional repressor) of toxin-antitoxin stability system
VAGSRRPRRGVVDALVVAARLGLVKILDTHDKTTLSQLVDQLASGEDVILSRAGRPVARVIAIQTTGRRTLGQWRGRVRMSDDFDAPLPEAELAAWHGEPA